MVSILYLHSFIHLILVGVLIALSIIDYKTMHLPDKLTLPLLGLGLINSCFDGLQSFSLSVISVIITGAFFLLISLIYPKGMGLGDVKFMAALASFFTLPDMVIILFLASIMGTFIGLVLFVIRRDKFQRQIPFGPYLSLGTLVVLIWGNKIFPFFS